MTNLHTAKKIRKGCYLYRGYTVEEMGQFDGSYTRWNITSPDESEAHDTSNTLKKAKLMIDRWEG